MAGLFIILFSQTTLLLGQQDPIEKVFWEMYYSRPIEEVSLFINSSIESYPNRYNYLLLRANVFLKENAPEKAKKDIDQYLSGLPPTSETHLLLGESLLAMNKPKEAIVSFSLARENTLGVTELKYCYLKLGEAYNKTGMYKLAQENLLKAEDIFNSNIDYLYNIGIAQLNLNLISEFEITKNRILELHPNNILTHALLAEYYTANGEYSTAISFCEKKINSGNATYEDYELLKELASVNSDTLMLIKANEGLLMYNKDDVNYYLTLEKLYRSKEEYTKALTCINKAISMNKDKASLYVSKGELYFLFGQKTKACDCFFTALKKGFSTNEGNLFLENYINNCE